MCWVDFENENETEKANCWLDKSFVDQRLAFSCTGCADLSHNSYTTLRNAKINQKSNFSDNNLIFHCCFYSHEMNYDQLVSHPLSSCAHRSFASVLDAGRWSLACGYSFLHLFVTEYSFPSVFVSSFSLSCSVSTIHCTEKNRTGSAWPIFEIFACRFRHFLAPKNKRNAQNVLGDFEIGENWKLTHRK